MSSASVPTYSRNKASTVARSSGQRASVIDSKPPSRISRKLDPRRTVAPINRSRHQPIFDGSDDALQAFKKTLKEKEEEDKVESLAPRLTMIALSLCGGGILTGAFGTTVLKTIAVDTGRAPLRL